MPERDKTVLFLFGRRPLQASVLDAAVAAEQLARQGCDVQVAALSRRAAELLRSRLNRPAAALHAGLAWLGRLGHSQLAFRPAAVHAWDLEAASCTGAIAGHGVPIRLTLCESAMTDLASGRNRKCLAAAACVICHSQPVYNELLQAGVSTDRVRLLAPAVDPARMRAAQARRPEIRQALGLAAADAPVFTVPQQTGRDAGHQLAAWSTFLLRRGGVPARLLLPEPSRQAARIMRFGAACGEQAGIAVAPAGTPPLEILAAANALVVPSQGLYDPVIVAWAMSGGLLVVTAGVERDPPLLDGLTCLTSADTRPLNLARAMLRVWQDRSLAASITSAASQRIRCLCNPADCRAGGHAGGQSAFSH
jgi:hypothetical protein